LGIVFQLLTSAVIQVVFETHSNVTAHQRSECRHRQLKWANTGAQPDRVARELLQKLKDVLGSRIARRLRAHYGLYEIGWLEEPFVDQIPNYPGTACMVGLHLGFDCMFLHASGEAFDEPIGERH